MKKGLVPVILIIITLLFFWKFFLQGLLPIPADTIVGMYHPFRDFYSHKYPNGIPFKNFLTTDPVRQQYPWRKLAIDSLKQGKWPLWNPYNFAGTPLLANFQSATFYPLNILFFILPFDLSWSILVILQPVLAGIFLFLYLRHFNLRPEACFLGAVCFAFSGFFIAWLEWNTVLHVALWLPLVLLSIDKIFYFFKTSANSKLNSQFTKLARRKLGTQFHQTQNESFALFRKLKKHLGRWRGNDLDSSEVNLVSANLRGVPPTGGPPSEVTKVQNFRKSFFFWSFVFLFSLISSFFAGHLQTFFYILATSLIYTIVRILSLETKGRRKAFLLFAISYLLFTVITSIQWLPTLQFINLSAREFDLPSWQNPGWFIPWQHLVQFLVPDFFGNPSTLNYWGVWNYGEFIGYIGILPFIMALLAMVWRRDKKTLFFGTVFFLSLIFATPTWFAKLPYQLKIPFLSSSQPTRLLFLADFSLAVLAALGFDYYLRSGLMISIIKAVSFIGLVFGGLWFFVLFGSKFITGDDILSNLNIAKRNLLLPTGLFFISTTLFFLAKIMHFLGKDHLRGGPAGWRGLLGRWRNCRCLHLGGVLKSRLGGGFREKRKTSIITNYQLAIIFLLIIVIFDLFRFGWKFTPFSKREYLFPTTAAIKFLQSKPQPFRIMTTDRRILPPNFSIMYGIQTIEGYDPLYIRRYGELLAAWERGKPDISPFSFNRIIRPQNFESRIADLLNVKYVLSLEEIKSPKLELVFQEGQTRVYENKQVFPRVFLTEHIKRVSTKKEAIEALFDEKIDLHKTAIVEEDINLPKENLDLEKEGVKIVKYSENQVVLKIKTLARRLLVLADNFYSSWNVKIDGKSEKIYRIDYALRGVSIPAGEHELEFYINPR